MTKQIQDILVYNNSIYRINYCWQVDPFSIKEFNFKRNSFSSTASYRGFQIQYKIIANRLYLDEFYLSESNEEYHIDKLLYGVKPERLLDDYSSPYNKKYTSIHKELNFTGLIFTEVGYYNLSYFIFEFTDGELISLHEKAPLHPPIPLPDFL